MNRSTIIAAIGVFVFVAIIITTVSVVSHSSELGRVATLEEQGVTADSEQMKEEEKLRFAPGQLIVKFKRGYSSASIAFQDLADQLEVYGVEELFPFKKGTDLEGIYILSFPIEKSVEEVISEFGRSIFFEFVEPNHIARGGVIAPVPPNDPSYSQQWHLPKIFASQAWLGLSSPNLVPVIAVIDTGVQWSHPDLANNIRINSGEIPNNGIDDDSNNFIDDDKGWDFVETFFSCPSGEDCNTEDNDPNDFHGHGTHVAGIAGAVTNNNLGISGVCSNFCKIMALRAGFAFPSGQSGFEYDDIAQSLVYAADNGAHIINMSFGGINSQLMQTSIDYAYTQGVVLVAAAMNRFNNYLWDNYPAAYDKVIAVGATDQNDLKTSFSNYGAWVDIAAPGFNIYSTISPTSPMNTAQNPSSCTTASGCYNSLSGTSMSTPIISGVIGLAFAKNPSLTQSQIVSLVHSSYNSLSPTNQFIGTGRINALKALTSSLVNIAHLSPQLDHSANGPQALSIVGSAYGQSFLKYKVEIGQGNYPSLWTTIQADTFIPVTNNVLATVNPQLLNLQKGLYSLRLQLTDINQKTWEDRTVFIVDPSLVSGWGKTIPDYTNSPPIVFDVDNNGGKELFFNAARFSSLDNIFYALDHNGLSLSGWPKVITNSYNPSSITVPFSFPAIDNIDSDPAIEAVFNVAHSPIAGRYVYESNGNIQTGWPVSIGAFPSYVRRVPPVIANIDGGSDKEIIFVRDGFTSHPLVNHCQGSEIFIYKQDGTPLPGWPIPFACSVNSPTVGDIDGNGDIEIVISLKFGNTNQPLFVFNHDGTLFSGWPLNVGGGASSPILADLDQNDGGRLEIVQAGGDDRLYVLNDDGSNVAGWPRQFGFGENNYFSSFPAIADVDNNGDLEIIIASYNLIQLYVFNHDGTNLAGWPISLGGTFVGLNWDSSPLIADLDGNGYKEIIIGRNNQLVAYNYDGTVSNGFPKPIMYRSASSYAIGDLDGDGLIDIFATDDGGNMYRWEFTGQATPQNLPWPMARHDAQNTGKY